MMKGSFCKRLAVSFLAGAVVCGTLSGCDSSSGLEKPAPGVDLKPDMNRMPGFNDMQEKMKAKKGATSRTPAPPPASR
jgi:hypothetical protein